MTVDSLAARWNKECGFQIPACFKSAKNTRSRNIKMFTQFDKASGYSPHRENAVISFIPCLLLIRLPSAVLWAIVAVVVDSSNRFIYWAFAHIVKKIFKFGPSLTNRYSSSSISFKCRVGRIFASSFHSRPRVVGSSNFSLLAVPVLKMPLLSKFDLKAPARLAHSRKQIGILDDSHCAAIALANRFWFRTGMAFLNNKKSSKSSSYGAEFLRHIIVFPMLCKWRASGVNRRSAANCINATAFFNLKLS